jgi:hypothetical protein
MHRLDRKDQELGTVSGVVGEFPWMHGEFTPTAVDPEFREFFDFMSGEDPGEPPFDEALLDEEKLVAGRAGRDEAWDYRPGRPC